MLNLKVAEIKDFTNKLLLTDTFDTFLTTSVLVAGGVTYTIDGTINKDFYDKEALEAMVSSKYATWGTLRPHVYNVIRGSSLPLKFKIVFVLSDSNISRIIEKNNLLIRTEDIANLSLNIFYDGQDIHITSTATMNTFTLDKTLERLWDENLQLFFKKTGILLSQ
jgi:hypothetical protein